MINSSTLKEEERVAFKREQVCFVLHSLACVPITGWDFFFFLTWGPSSLHGQSLDVKYKNVNMHVYIFAISNRMVDMVYWRRVLRVAMQLWRDMRIYFYWLQLLQKHPEKPQGRFLLSPSLFLIVADT